MSFRLCCRARRRILSAHRLPTLEWRGPAEPGPSNRPFALAAPVVRPDRSAAPAAAERRVLGIRQRAPLAPPPAASVKQALVPDPIARGPRLPGVPGVLS